MRLLLTSVFTETAGLLADKAGEHLEGKTVTFIPTASLTEQYRDYVDEAWDCFCRLGMVPEMLEVSKAPAEEIAGKLTKNDMIYISGGNSFFLLRELRRSGADRLVMGQIRAGKLYIGESAGSVILAPDITYVREMDDPASAPGLSSFRGLGAVPFYPVPHCKNKPFRDAAERIVKQYGQALRLVPFHNAQALWTDGTEVSVLGPAAAEA